MPFEKSLGRRSVYDLPKRAIAASAIGIGGGVLETFCGYLVVYSGFLVGKTGGGPGGAGQAFLMYLSIPAGLLMITGGALILSQKYFLGGGILLVSGLCPL